MNSLIYFHTVSNASASDSTPTDLPQSLTVWCILCTKMTRAVWNHQIQSEWLVLFTSACTSRPGNKVKFTKVLGFYNDHVWGRNNPWKSARLVPSTFWMFCWRHNAITWYSQAGFQYFKILNTFSLWLQVCLNYFFTHNLQFLQYFLKLYIYKAANLWPHLVAFMAAIHYVFHQLASQGCRNTIG